MPWPEQLVHVIDFEGSLGSGILEYGVVSWRAGAIVATHTRRCGATGRVRPEDAAVHGLDAADVAGEPPFAEDFAFFAGLRETGPLAAHFAGAENMLIKSVWPYPRRSPDFARGHGDVLEWGPWIDTGRLYPQMYPSAASARLEELVVEFRLQPALDAVATEHCPAGRRRYHAALYDALAAALLLARLATEPTVAGQSVGWLLHMSTLDPEKRADLTQGDLF